MKTVQVIPGQGDFKEPYDWDAYAETFFPQAEELITRAHSAETLGNKEEASELYLCVSSSST